MGTPVVGLALLVIAALPISAEAADGAKVKLALTVLVLVSVSDTRNCAAVAMRIASLSATLTPAASFSEAGSMANRF